MADAFLRFNLAVSYKPCLISGLLYPFFIISLSIALTIAYCKLKYDLQRFFKGGAVDEAKRVKTIFIILIFCFVSRLVFYAISWPIAKVLSPGVLGLINFVMYIPWDILPLMNIINYHRYCYGY